jgi:hypothetical protein
MSKVVQSIETLHVVSLCFSKLAGKVAYQKKWRTNDQWCTLLWAYYQEVLSNLIDQHQLDGKLLDAALRKDKIIKSNLSNYVEGTNATDIMCRSYKPRVTINGIENRTQVYCYITLSPYSAEPNVTSPGQSWWQTLPPVRTRESERHKRSRQATKEDEEGYDEKSSQKRDETVKEEDAANPEPMKIETSFDPWDDTNVKALFLTDANEHSKDAIARCIDILMDARTEPDGYKTIIEGGDPMDNCTKLDIIKSNDKSIYLISALSNALKFYLSKTWIECCKEASNSCSIITNSYSYRTIADWWIAFRQKNAFPIHEALIQ